MRLGDMEQKATEPAENREIDLLEIKNTIANRMILSISSLERVL